MQPYIFGYLNVPKHRWRCYRCPNYPSTLPHCVCILTSSTFFLPASRLDSTYFAFFLCIVLLSTQKGSFPSSLSFSSCVLSAQDPPQPICTTKFPPSLFFMCFCRLCSLIFCGSHSANLTEILSPFLACCLRHCSDQGQLPLTLTLTLSLTLTLTLSLSLTLTLTLILTLANSLCSPKQ